MAKTQTTVTIECTNEDIQAAISAWLLKEKLSKHAPETIVFHEEGGKVVAIATVLIP